MSSTRLALARTIVLPRINALVNSTPNLLKLIMHFQCIFGAEDLGQGLHEHLVVKFVVGHSQGVWTPSAHNQFQKADMDSPSKNLRLLSSVSEEESD